MAPTTTTVQRGVIEYKSAAVTDVGGGAVETEDPYVFNIIASVTGIPDEVNDIIEPGAYADTLARRMPKVIKDHDWAQRLGKVMDIRELPPGDAGLPKTTARGAPWPKAAGALIAKVRLFAGTKAGEEARVRWAEYGPEQEFSIGYAVPPGTSRKDGKHRRLPKMDLFELSDVLFGAMPLAGVVAPALATKMLAAVDSDPDTALPDNGVPDNGVPAPRTPAQALAAARGAKAAPRPGLEGKYDTSPLGEPGNRENWVDKAGGLPSFIRAIANALVREEGKSESQAIQIAIGVCKNWAAGGEDVKPGTRAKAQAAIAQWEKMKASTKGDGKAAQPGRIGAGDYDPSLEHGPFAGCLAPDGDLESKAYPNLPGTVEERMEALREALWENFRGAPREPAADETAPVGLGGGKFEWDYLSIVGTWADRVVFTRNRWAGGDSSDRESWEVPYTFDTGPDGSPAISFGEAEEVRLEVQAVPTTPPAAAPDPAADPTAEPPAAPEDEPGYVEAALSVADLVTRAADLATLAMPVRQTKAGRVLSASNAGRLRTAVETLLQVLRDAGLPISTDSGVDDDDLTPDTLDETPPDSTAPSAQRMARTKGLVTVAPDERARALAILAAAAED